MGDENDDTQEENSGEQSAEALAEKSRFNAEMFAVPATDPRDSDGSDDSEATESTGDTNNE